MIIRLPVSALPNSGKCMKSHADSLEQKLTFNAVLA